MNVPPEPPRALAEALDAAELLRYSVHEWVSRLRMLNAALRTRAVFPTAAAVLIDIENQHVEPEGVQLAGVLDASGAVLWSAINDQGAPVIPPAIDRVPWCAVLWLIETDLTAALGTEDPDEQWEHQPEMAALLRGPGAFGADFLYRAELPTEADLAAVVEPAQPHEPDLPRLTEVLTALLTTATAAIAAGCTFPAPATVVQRHRRGEAVSG